jgi:DNA repair exonuclease SbcCD nuclease subunit
MKVLFIGDMHLKINRFELAKQFLAWTNSIVELEKPDIIVNLGDCFDTHAIVRSEILTEFMRHVEHSIKTCKYVYLLGNHDQWKPNDSTYHAVRHLKGKIKDFYVIDSIQDLFDMTFVPYVHKPEDFPTSTKQICIAHQTFKGADYGDITTKDGVDPDTVSADLIISGHIHKKQTLGKVIYPGSPFSQSINDINQTKGLLLFNSNTFDQKFIECPLPKWRGAKFELTPIYSSEDMDSDIRQLIKSNQDHWVFEITGPKAEITSYLSSKETVALMSSIDVKIKTIFTDKEKKMTAIKAVSVDSIVKEYIDKVYSGALNKHDLYIKSNELFNKIKI